MEKVAKETYRGQIMRLVDAMTRPNHQLDVADDLVAGSNLSRVKMFVDGNLEKRFDKLQVQLESVADVFEDFESLIIEYVRDNKSAAFDNVTSDAERMLVWLAQTQSPSAEQLDMIACQRARHEVENVGRKNRLKHIRFQELIGLTEQFLPELETNAQLRIHLNPIRSWSRFHTTALLDDESTTPADVLFFAVGAEIHTAVLELEGQALINELADFQPCTLDEWVALTMQSDRHEIMDTCRDLAEMGLVAFG